MAEDFHFVFGPKGPIRVGRDEYAERWPYRTKAPTWYAARQAHNIGCLDPESWSDKPELYAWLKELVSILWQPDLVERYRRELLTPEELASVRREQADIEENGW
jgi:hypothetical protein